MVSKCSLQFSLKLEVLLAQQNWALLLKQQLESLKLYRGAHQLPRLQKAAFLRINRLEAFGYRPCEFWAAAEYYRTFLLTLHHQLKIFSLS